MSIRESWHQPHHPYNPLPYVSHPTRHSLLRSLFSILSRPALCFPLLISILAVILINPHTLPQSLQSRHQHRHHPQLPPPLSLHFAHLQRPSCGPLPPPPDWRRPSVLTVHARSINTNTYILTIFTTGTDAGWFHRDLKLAGCAIDNDLYPAHKVQPEMVACRITRLPPVGATITALLIWDQHLQSAIHNPHWIAGVSFPILSGDVRPANSTLRSKPVAFVHSNLRWYPALFDPPQLNPPRYELCVMTQIKHDTHLLPDWLAFYRRMGVDRFYLYDNRASSDLARFASPHIELVYWPWIRAQSQAYTHFLLASKRRCKYAAFFDVDEYAFVGGNQPNMLKAYMDHRVEQGYGQVVFPQLQMNSNGYIKRPWGPIPERYTRAEKYQRGFGVKPLLRTDIPWVSHRINQAWGGKASTYFNMSVIPSPTSFDDNAIIVHFLSRSWEEFVAKRREGSTAVTERYFPPALLNTSNPQAWYLSQAHSSDMFEFRTFWRRVMRMKDRGAITITWDKNNQTCRQPVCPQCLFWNIGTTWCEHR